MREIAERITGVSADDEQQRIEDQQKYEAEQADKYDNGDTGIGNIFATGKPAVVDVDDISKHINSKNAAQYQETDEGDK